MALPNRKTAKLSFGRVSAPSAAYFITFCTKDRTPVLTESVTGTTVVDAMQSMHASGDIELIAATLMPDHVHLLLTLGNRLGVGQVMGKIKSQSRHRGKAAWRWQEDGFEHQLRTIESIEDYGFYIFMNPYRAGLCAMSTDWRWWICPQPTRFHFLARLGAEQNVPLEWLGLCEQVATRITTCA